MPFKLRKQAPGKLIGDIFQYEDIHGKRLFEQRLFETVQQNSKVQQVRLRPTHVYLDIYENISQWQIKNYKVPQTLEQVPQVLKSISSIHFPNLIQLHLTNLCIESIQPLQWLNSPSVITIDLTSNHITKLQPLIKSNFPNLLYLIFLENEVVSCNLTDEFKHLSKVQVKDRKMDTLRFVYKDQKAMWNDDEEHQTLSFVLVKRQGTSICRKSLRERTFQIRI